MKTEMVINGHTVRIFTDNTGHRYLRIGSKVVEIAKDVVITFKQVK